MKPISCDVHVDKNGYELASHGNTFFPVAIYDDDITHNPVAWHWHDEFEILIVYEGTVLVNCGTEEYIVSKGEGVFTNAGILHFDKNYNFGHSCCFHSIVFHPRLIGGSIDSIFWQNYLQPILSNPSLQGLFLSPNIPWQNQILNHIESAWQAMKSEHLGYEFEVRTLLSQIIFSIKNNTCILSNSLSPKQQRDMLRMKQMLQYIQTHYMEEIDIEEIAQSALISVSECLRCFKNTIHTTPIQYTIEYRLKKAAELLSATDFTVTEIGTQCGFVDMSYFSRMFKKFYGCTPKKYRNHCYPK